MQSATSNSGDGNLKDAPAARRENPAAFYRLKASDCLRFAEEARDQETRDQWITLADGWPRLAMHQPA
jgi:hypothetical protein